MNVTVRYHGIIGDMLRRKTQQVEMLDGATVSDLLAVVIGSDETLPTGGQEIMPLFAPEVIRMVPTRIAGVGLSAGTSGFTVTSRTVD